MKVRMSVLLLLGVSGAAWGMQAALEQQPPLQPALMAQQAAMAQQMGMMPQQGMQAAGYPPQAMPGIMSQAVPGMPQQMYADPAMMAQQAAMAQMGMMPQQAGYPPQAMPGMMPQQMMPQMYGDPTMMAQQMGMAPQAAYQQPMPAGYQQPMSQMTPGLDLSQLSPEFMQMLPQLLAIYEQMVAAGQLPAEPGMAPVQPVAPTPPPAPPVLIMVAADGYSVTEFAALKQYLDAAGFPVQIASNKLDEFGRETNVIANGAVGIRDDQQEEPALPANMVLEDVIQNGSLARFVGVFFVGGPGSLKGLENNYTKHLSYAIARKAKEEQLPLGAICLPVRILVRAGVLKGDQATGWNEDGVLYRIDKMCKETGLMKDHEVTFMPGSEPDLILASIKRPELKEWGIQPVVFAEGADIITSTGPSTAAYYGLAATALLTCQGLGARSCYDYLMQCQQADDADFKSCYVPLAQQVMEAVGQAEGAPAG